MARVRELSSFHQAARDLLDKEWRRVIEVTALADTLDKEWGPRLAKILREGGSTYPYVLITQLLGKATDSNLNALCLQDSSTLEGAWDARSLAAKVVVPWNDSINKPLPGANADPYVNNPARHKHFGDDMRSKAQNIAMYQHLEEIASRVEKNSGEASRLLGIALLEIRHILETDKRDYFGPSRASLSDVSGLLDRFLSEKSNGIRLQVICYAVVRAFAKAFPNFGDVRSYPVNAADTSGDRAGDVERSLDGEKDLAIEVKERTLTLSDVEATILKARKLGIRDVIFVIHAWPIQDQPEKIHERAAHEFTRGIDVNVAEAIPFFRSMLRLLTPEQRAQLLRGIHDALHELGAHYKHVHRWMELLKSI